MEADEYVWRLQGVEEQRTIRAGVSEPPQKLTMKSQQLL
jgi:hypothetical protein